MGIPMRASTLRVFATAAFAALAAISSASAADIVVPSYTKAPPPMIVVYNWTGFYIGGNAGYSWGRSRTDVNFYNGNNNVLLATGGSSFDMNGWVAGAQAGYNWQTERWVYGFEADGQGTGQRGNTALTCAGPICSFANTAIAPLTLAPVNTALANKLEWFATFRARAGYTFTPTVLGYVTGGLAVGGVKSSGVITGFNANGQPIATVFGSSDNAHAGWTVGAGVEASLGGNWTGKIEYLYMDLGRFNTSALLPTNAPPILATYSSRITDNIVRAGINYRFGGPVVARY
jgi:outer membrane immunogenic protein